MSLRDRPVVVFGPAMRLRYGLCILGLHKKRLTTVTYSAGEVVPVVACDRCWKMWEPPTIKIPIDHGA